MTSLFRDRRDAGRRLGLVLQRMNLEDPVILALPRGGVVVADEVADILHRPLDVIIARKIGAPGQKEFGIGALSEDARPIFNPSVSDYYDEKDPIIQRTIERETDELRRRVDLYRHGQSLPKIEGKHVIVVDDGLATGVTAAAAGNYLKTLRPKQLLLAVPVGPEALSRIVEVAYDEIICLYRLSSLMSVGQWYEEFYQTEDEEVLSILQQRREDQDRGDNVLPW